jgi:hypothetical protein
MWTGSRCRVLNLSSWEKVAVFGGVESGDDGCSLYNCSKRSVISGQRMCLGSHKKGEIYIYTISDFKCKIAYTQHPAILLPKRARTFPHGTI